jgi:Skp family chaperone for outer membrane proteins
MNKTIIAVAAAAALAGCAASQSPVGVVDLQRITANWPQYANAYNQMLADERAIEVEKASPSQKQRQASAMNAKYQTLSAQLVGEVRSAAAKVAQQRNLKLVVTCEFVGYGGVNITPEVEKAMGITESASPPPNASHCGT